MSLIFYNIFLFFYRQGIGIAASFNNNKARKWLQGRKNIFPSLSQAINGQEKIMWIHCASLGEFEQGRPILEKLKTIYPDYKILLTFFSPSGYEIRKNYEKADYVFYLPADSASNAKRFLDIITPRLVIFVKYEFWYHYTSAINKRNIPFILISAVFRQNQPFFSWYGSLHRKMLNHFTHIFVQDINSLQLLKNLGFYENASIAGDTRFDRVAEIAEKFEPIETIEKFCTTNKTIVAGSTWPDDEKMLSNLTDVLDTASVKLIIAPHEINKEHLEQIQTLFPNAILYSQISFSPITDSPVLIIDSIGILSRLYHYAYIAYIGGGFTKDGIHNVLEAAVYSKPVIFGPNYNKYREAIELVECGGAKSYTHTDDLIQIIRNLLNNKTEYERTCHAAGNYVQENKGATEKIIGFIQEKRLLTN